MSHISSFPSETLPLYHSNPAEILLMENVPQLSTAGQWVEGRHILASRVAFHQRLENVNVLYSGSQTRVACPTSPWCLTPFHYRRAPWDEKPQMMWLVTELSLQSATLLSLAAWDPGTAYAELAYLISYVRLIFWKWKPRCLVGETRTP